MKSVCLYARSSQNELYGKIGLNLETQGYKTTYIIQNRREERVLSRLGCRGGIHNLTTFIREHWDDEDLFEHVSLSDIERRYGIDSIWRLFYTDRFLVKYGYEDAVKFIKLHVAFFERLISIGKFDVLLNEAIALYSSYIFYVIARKHGCRYLGLTPPRNLAHKKFCFTDNTHATLHHLDRFYREGDFSDAELESARTFVADLKKHRTKPEYMRISGRKPRFTAGFAYDLLKYLYCVCRRIEKYDYEFHGECANTCLYRLRNYLKYRFQKRYYRYPVPGEQYYLFPLHFQPESTTLVGAQNYEKQIYAVDLIAKKLPGDSILYVKEHYAHLGHRDTEFYRKAAGYPNVRIIRPHEDSHELLQKSLGVIVLTSTVGWEAILYGKPVFLLGRVFYESFKYTHIVRHIDDLTAALKSARENPIEPEAYNSELMKYVAAYLKSLRSGYYGLDDPSVLIQANVESLSEEIINEMETFVAHEDRI